MLAHIFFCIAIILMIIATFLFVVRAFQKSILWGLSVLFIPYAGLIFICIYLTSRHPVVKLYLLSILFFILSAVFYQIA